jgi:hypothetical protein
MKTAMAVILGAGIVIAVLVTRGAPSTARPAAPAPPRQRIDLSPSAEAASVVVELVRTWKGEVVRKLPQGPARVPLEEVSSLRWVDETSRRAPDIPRDDRRTWLEYRIHRNGRNCDRGFNGIQLAYREEGGRGTVRVVPPRRVLDRHLERMRREEGFVGCRLPLPRDARIGERMDFDCRSLIHTLFDLDGRIRDIETSFRFAGSSPTSGRAMLAGDLRWIEDVESGDVSMSSTYAASVEIEIEPATRALAEIRFASTLALAGTGASAGLVAAEALIEGRLTTCPSAGAPAALTTPPAFRENAYLVSGLEIRIPSCWLVSINEGKQVFHAVDSRDDTPAQILVQGLAHPFDVGSDEFLAVSRDALLEIDPDATVERAFSAALGDGMRSECHPEPGELHEHFVFQIAEGRQVSVRLFGEDDAVKAKSAGFRKIVEALRPAEGLSSSTPGSSSRL